MTHMTHRGISARSGGGRWAWLAAALILAAGAAPAQGQAPSVDTILTKLFASEIQDPYELTADFHGTLTLIVRGSRISALASGSYLEWRKAGDHKRRKITIERLEVPLLLRPFTGTLRKLIEDKIESQSESPEAFHAHDIFIAAELPAKRYLLIGVHRAIVDDAIDRYGRPQDKRDPATRRKIAQWLYNTPGKREFLVRPGPPYAMRAVLDDDGLLYDLIILYDWGEVATKISYVPVSGMPSWRQVTSDATSDLTGIGRVNGDLTLTFSNHCLNCRTTRR